jgi:iron-sulfur cluster assembly protein
MDFEESKLGSSFTFKNPNQTGECGCGESVQLKPADLKALAEARSHATA